MSEEKKQEINKHQRNYCKANKSRKSYFNKNNA